MTDKLYSLRDSQISTNDNNKTGIISEGSHYENSSSDGEGDAHNLDQIPTFGKYFILKKNF